MSLRLINQLASVLTLLILAGCATNKEELLSHDDQTMHDIWMREAAGSSGGRVTRELLDARQTLRRPLTSAEVKSSSDDRASYTRKAQNEIYRQFQRLPNPDLVMYIYPHLSGTALVPVPGYSTVFPLYQRVQYALPGERVEDY